MLAVWHGGLAWSIHRTSEEAGLNSLAMAFVMIGFAIGTLIGGALQWLIQVPHARKAGFRYEPILDWRDEGFRHVMRLVGPDATIAVLPQGPYVLVDCGE